MSNLIPGEPLIYENVDGIIYARYRDKPYSDIPRWIVGGDPAKVSIKMGMLISYDDWRDMHSVANKYPEFKKQLQKLIKLYYLYKEN